MKGDRYARRVADARGGEPVMDKLTLEPFRPTLADLLREALADILDDYEHELRVLDSPLMKDEGSRSQCLAHARLIIGTPPKRYETRCRSAATTAWPGTSGP